jgi:hypothetical protein
VGERNEGVFFHLPVVGACNFSKLLPPEAMKGGPKALPILRYEEAGFGRKLLG